MPVQYLNWASIKLHKKLGLRLAHSVPKLFEKKLITITKTRLYNFDPLKSQFYYINPTFI